MFKNYITKLFLSVIFFSISFSQEKITLEDIFSGQKFKTKSLSMPKWMKKENEYSFAEFNSEKKSLDLFLYDVETKTKKLFVDANILVDPISKDKLSFHSFQISPDEKNMLITGDPPQRQYLSRLTPAGNYYLLNLNSKEITKLTNVTEPQYNQKFSPDGKYLGFVRNNNIILLDLETGKELSITNDGSEDVINGKFDWVYEEEFGISDGWQFSPNGEEIAFWKSNQSLVKEFLFTEYDSTYLRHIKMKYPKAGEDNSLVNICVYNIKSGKTKYLDFGEDPDFYVPRIFWTGIENILAVLKLNRDQNNLDIIYCNTKTGQNEIVLNEKANKWLDIHDHFEFVKNGDFIYSSERDNFLHFYLFNYKTKESKQITKGNWEVESYYGFNENENKIYYSSSEDSPLERQIYSISLNGKNKKKLTLGVGTHSANFSKNNKYFIDNYSNSNTLPQIYLMNNLGEKIISIAENSNDIFKNYNFSFPEFIKFKTSDGIELNASILKPSDFNPNKKYPVFISTYGGPGSQVVKNSWSGFRNFLWHNLLLQKGYLVFMVDNRGTGSRGRDFRQITYKNLGEWEIFDQIEGVKYLSKLNFVDSTRIGIFGWSYGGYMSSLAITKGSEYFKTAIAVAPVTDWKLYDNIYTERYMSTPKKNPDGYKNSSPLNYTDKYKGKLLLIHGNSDDNVHFQNSAQFVAKLQSDGKSFETMFYPNKNHGIYGGKIPLHLYRLMTEFIEKNL